MQSAVNEIFRVIRIRLFILLACCTTCFSSCSAENEISKTPNSQTISTQAVVKDTVEVSFDDTVGIGPKENNLKLILLKEESDSDYLKYVFPIFTLLLGIAVNKFLDWLHDKKKTKRAGKRWVAEIRSLENPIEKQIELLESFLEDHNQEKFAPPKLTILAILSCEIFKSLDKSEFLKYIENNRNIRHEDAVRISNRTHGLISVLSNYHETLKAKFHQYLGETSKRSSSFSQNLQSVMREFTEFGIALETELGSDPIQNPYYKAMLDLISSEIMPNINDGKYDVFKLQKGFFLPMLGILGNLRLDERSKPLTLAVSNCLSDIKGIKMEKGYLTEILETIIDRYKTQLPEIKIIIDSIEGK
jgi:hypothetical protein